ncbi:MAG: Ig-like domain-containing protein [Mycoplasmoidaceae bacterium]
MKKVWILCAMPIIPLASSSIIGCSSKPIVPDTDVVHVTGVTFDVQQADIPLGESYQIHWTVTPENATNKDVSFSVDRGGYIFVDYDGLIHSTSVGTVTLTIKTKDGGFTDAVTVNVKQALTLTFDADPEIDPEHVIIYPTKTIKICLHDKWKYITERYSLPTAKKTQDWFWFDSWYLANAAPGQKIDDDYVFEENATIYPYFDRKDISYFQTDPWEKVIDYVEQGVITEAYNCQMNDFIGEQRSVKLNGIDQSVTVIGVNHDIIADVEPQKTAQFTFQFTNVVCKSDKTPMKHIWGPSNRSYWKEDIAEFENFHSYLNFASTSSSKTFYDLFGEENPNIMPHVKTVTRKIYQFQRSGSSWSLTTGSEQFFLPSRANLNGEGGEGSRYAFYSQGAPYIYIKKDLNDNNCLYWIGSPQRSDIQSFSWFVDANGNIVSENYDDLFVSSACPFAPCFCI